MVNGKIKYFYGKTKEEATEKMRNAICKKEVETSCKKLTFLAWARIWLKDFKLNSINDPTRTNYAYLIESYIEPSLYAWILLSKLEAYHIQSIYNELLNEKGLSIKTVRNLHGVIHSCLKKAVQLKYIPENVAEYTELPKLTRKEMDPLNNDELKRFLKAIEGDSLELMLKTDVFSGLGISELIGLTWDCVNFDTGEITVNKQLKRERKAGGLFLFCPPKHNKCRTLAVPEVVTNSLKMRREIQKQDKERAGSAWLEYAKNIQGNTWSSNFENLVFTNEIGTHIFPNILSRHFKKALIKGGIPERRFHDLRHTYATLFIAADNDYKVLQENLGHHDVSFTLATYGHLTKEFRCNNMQNNVFNIVFVL